jgi:group I intron endonuclease
MEEVALSYDEMLDTTKSNIDLSYHDIIDELEANINKIGASEFETHHLFSEGIYLRTIVIPAGSFLISKIHKTEHPFFLTAGEITLFFEDYSFKKIPAPFMGITYPGTRRVAIADSQCKWTTAHAIPFITGNENDLPKDELDFVLGLIEDIVIEPRELLNVKYPKKIGDITKCAGIYKITNKVTGDFYIGSASKFYDRWKAHKHNLNKKRKSANAKLLNAWNKYGSENFVFSVLEVVEDKTQLLAREQHWIDILNPHYNICKIAGATYGIKHTEERKAEISQRMKGNKYKQGHVTVLSPEIRKQISDKLKGTKHSEESYKKAAETRKWYKPTKENLKKASIAIRKASKPINEEIIIPTIKSARVGALNGKTKLNDNDVLLIRKLWKDGLTAYEIIDETKLLITRSVIYAIVRRKTWKHI